MSSRGRVEVRSCGLATAAAWACAPRGRNAHIDYVPDLLADGLGPARAVLLRILREQGVGPLRQRRAEILENLPERARSRLSVALGKGDAAAARLVGLRANPEQELFEGESAFEQEPPLGESDAREILGALGRWEHGWVLRGLGSALLGASPHGPGFMRALRALLPVLIQLRATLTLEVWDGALGALHRWDPALSAAGSIPGLPDADVAREAWARRLGLRAIVAPDLFRVGEHGAVITAWPTSRVPASRVVGHVADAIQPVRTMPVAALVPDWALGRHNARARAALSAAYPRLRWVPVTIMDLVALGGEEVSVAESVARAHCQGDPQVELRLRPGQWFVGASLLGSGREVGDQLRELLPRLVSHAVSAGVRPVGPPQTVFEGEGRARLRARIPVSGPGPRLDDLEFSQEPGGVDLCLEHVGSYDGLAATHARLVQIARETGLALTGPVIESYLNDPATIDVTEWRTSVRAPLEP